MRVFDSGSAETTPAAWAARLEVFGRAAAPYLGDLISNSRVVGTSWGETFASVVRALRDRPPLRPNARFSSSDFAARCCRVRHVK